MLKEHIKLTCHLMNEPNTHFPVAKCHYHNTLDAMTYEIKLVVCLEDDIDLTGQHLNIIIHFLDRNTDKTLHGTVFEQIQTPYGANNHFNCELTLYNELMLLWQNRRSGIFYGARLQDILDETLHKGMLETHLNQYTQIRQTINQANHNRYPLHPSLTQYQESDGKFLDRQLRRHGVWKRYVQHDDHVELQLGDQNEAFDKKVSSEPLSINLSDTGMGLSDINYYDEITLYQANEQDPQTPLYSHQLIHPQGICKLNQLSPFVELNQRQLDTLTQTLVDSQQCRQNQVSGSFEADTLECGELINLDSTDPALADLYIALGFEGGALIEEIDMKFDLVPNHPNLYEQQHSFKARPAKINYRPYFDLIKDRQSAPKHKGIMDGITPYIEANTQDVVAKPDEIGRVALQFPYRYQIFCKGHQCRYTRTCLPTNHEQAGISFPLYQDSECAVMFAREELDRPIFIGTLANADHQHVNRSQTPRSEISLPQGQYWTQTHQLSGNHTLSIGTKHHYHQGNTQICLQSKPAHFTIKTDKNYTLEIRRLLKITI